MAGVTIAAAATAAKAAPLRTLIIGSGVTGAALASALTRLAREDGRPLIATTLFDKGRAPGGRMTTTRAVGEAAGSRADSGAQYLTETAHSKHRGQYDALAAAGVIKPVDGVILGQREAQRKLRNFVAPAGIASVVRHMLSSATTDAAAQGVPLTVVQSKEWAVTCADGSVATFDAVIVTIPTPQIMKLEGDVPALLEGSGASPGVAAVRYSSRYALVAYYGAETWATVHASLPYVGRYVSAVEDDIIRYISFDSAKRGVVAGPAPPAKSAAGAGSRPLVDLEVPEGKPTAGATARASPVEVDAHGGTEPHPSLVIHTSVEFGKTYVDTPPDKVAPIILEHLHRLHPGLPAPLEIKCHRWRYSQVTSAYHGPQPFVGADLARTAEEADRETAAAEAAVAADVKREAAAGGAGPVSAVVAAASAASSVGAIAICDRPPLLLAGDAFANSSFEGCLESAAKAAALLKKLLLVAS